MTICMGVESELWETFGDVMDNIDFFPEVVDST